MPAAVGGVAGLAGVADSRSTDPSQRDTRLRPRSPTLNDATSPHSVLDGFVSKEPPRRIRLTSAGLPGRSIRRTSPNPCALTATGDSTSCPPDITSTGSVPTAPIIRVIRDCCNWHIHARATGKQVGANVVRDLLSAASTAHLEIGGTQGVPSGSPDALSPDLTCLVMRHWTGYAVVRRPCRPLRRSPSGLGHKEWPSGDSPSPPRLESPLGHS